MRKKKHTLCAVTFFLHDKLSIFSVYSGISVAQAVSLTLQIKMPTSIILLRCRRENLLNNVLFRTFLSKNYWSEQKGH